MALLKASPMLNRMTHSVKPTTGVPSSDFKMFRYCASSASPLKNSCPCCSPTLRVQRISLNKESTWTHCGTVLDLESLPPSFSDWANATVNGDLVPQVVSFLTFVHSYLAEAGISSYWLNIRATRATHDFDVPRWHTGRPFLDLEGGGGEDGWKLCTTLVGPGTLFLVDGAKARVAQKKVKLEVTKTEAGSHECKAVRCLGCASMQEIVRQRLTEEFKDYKFVQAVPGECTLIKLGDNNGAIHSEPVSHGDRVFVNVVPGSEQELRKMMGRWGMPFPRAWSIPAINSL